MCVDTRRQCMPAYLFAALLADSSMACRQIERLASCSLLLLLKNIDTDNQCQDAVSYVIAAKQLRLTLAMQRTGKPGSTHLGVQIWS